MADVKLERDERRKDKAMELVKQLRQLSAENPSHRDCIDEAADEIDRLRYALKIAAKTFGEYAEIHAAKTPPDENKVRRNENLRDLCNEALTHNAICTPSGVQHDA